jgi:CrcB protein
MNKFLLICLGGAVGTGFRYFISSWALKNFGPSFPYGTVAVNIIGSFLITFLIYIDLSVFSLSTTLRAVLVTGVLGGFTTYSSFNLETLTYFEDGDWTKGVLNLVLTVGLCLLAGVLGLVVSRKLI